MILKCSDQSLPNSTRRQVNSCIEMVAIYTARVGGKIAFGWRTHHLYLQKTIAHINQTNSFPNSSCKIGVLHCGYTAFCIFEIGTKYMKQIYKLISEKYNLCYMYIVYDVHYWPKISDTFLLMICPSSCL